MISPIQPLVSLVGAAASDLFGGSSGDGAGDLSLRALGRARMGTRGGRGLTVVAAKLRKVKKHEYPWPEDPDPSVKGRVLSQLSPFKPTPVTLEFDKPLMLFEKKTRDVRKMANETGLDFSGSGGPRRAAASWTSGGHGHESTRMPRPWLLELDSRLAAVAARARIWVRWARATQL